eukprot:648403-Prymnesium_polylepis.1
MADAWPTKDWGDRHFAEGLGFWEVNVYKALLMWHPDYKNGGLSHSTFRKMLAFTFLTLGKAQFGDDGTQTAAAEPSGPSNFHLLARFGNYPGEKHQCGFCNKGVGGYFYCKTCYPDGKPLYALCNPTLQRGCYEKHISGAKALHMCSIGIQKKTRLCVSPRQAAREQATRAGAPASDPVPPARRRI